MPIVFGRLPSPEEVCAEVPCSRETNPEQLSSVQRQPDIWRCFHKLLYGIQPILINLSHAYAECLLLNQQKAKIGKKKYCKLNQCTYQ